MDRDPKTSRVNRSPAPTGLGGERILAAFRAAWCVMLVGGGGAALALLGRLDPAPWAIRTLRDSTGGEIVLVHRPPASGGASTPLLRPLDILCVASRRHVGIHPHRAILTLEDGSRRVLPPVGHVVLVGVDGNARPLDTPIPRAFVWALEASPPPDGGLVTWLEKPRVREALGPLYRPIRALWP